MEDSILGFSIFLWKYLAFAEILDIFRLDTIFTDGTRSPG